MVAVVLAAQSGLVDLLATADAERLATIRMILHSYLAYDILLQDA